VKPAYVARQLGSAPNQQINRDGAEMFKSDKHMISSDDVAFGKEAIRETMAKLARAGMQLNCQTVPQGAIAWIIAESAKMYDHNRAWSIMESARQEMIADRQLDAPIFSSGPWRILKPEVRQPLEKAP
jgi:hypothetical protein